MNGAAIIGCGLAGRRRAQALCRMGIPVWAVFDPDRDRARLLAGELGGGADLASSLTAAVDRPGVDFAVVATPHDILADASTVALDAGCDVLAEKPGARTVEELDAVAAAAVRTARKVRVGFNHRFHPSVQLAQSTITDRRYGELFSIRGRYGHGGRRGYEHEWRTDARRSGGGELLDQGSHLIDLTRYLAGDVDLAFAELRTDYWPIAVEDNAYLALRTSSGALAWLHASWTEWRNCFEVELALRGARLDLRGLGGSYGPERMRVHEMRPELGPPETTSWEWAGSDRSWADEFAHFTHCIATGQRPEGRLQDALAVLQIVDQLYSSGPTQ